jgi:histidinol-phosphatase (PHP family)
MKEETLINFHIHSTGSDGKLTPEEVVKEAIKAGIKYICFTDHSPLPERFKDVKESHDEFYLKEMCNQQDRRKNFHNKEYIDKIKTLQREYKKEIDVSLGIELDWLEYDLDWIRKEASKIEYDYVLGSVHCVPLGGVYLSIEEGKEKFLEIVNNQFKGIEKFVKEYYLQIRNLAKSGLFDSIAHFDLIKMYNSDSSLFLEDSDWYKQEIKETLDIIAKSKTAIEINMHGLVKVTRAQYPSLWILKEARKRNIPITISTDAHRSGQVGQDLDKAYDLAREAGYSEIVRFKARKMVPIKI